MRTKQGQYSPEELDGAVDQVIAGKLTKEVSLETGITYSTMRKHAVTRANGEDEGHNRRGALPLLPAEAEESLSEWVVGRQQVGHPVERQEVIRKASAMTELMFGRGVGDGWYKRFMRCHPQLSTRTCQNLTKVRNSVDATDVTKLFGTMAKLIIEERYDSSRIFNVDETAFQSRRRTKQVVAIRGSCNVWSSAASASFHLTVVACGSAAGFVIPPVFILPGETVSMEILRGLNVLGAAITTTDLGFMNKVLFASWLQFFAAAVPTPIRRPLVRIMDGCGSHFSVPIVRVAAAYQIKLVCLPSNATHLFQPLYVAVFSSFKTKLHTALELLKDDTDSYTISKEKAIELVGLAWLECNFSNNIKSGFRACGLYPLSLLRMTECLQHFQRNGASNDTKMAAWLKVKTIVQSDLLVLPPPKKKTRRRTTATVAGRLLAEDLLLQIAEESDKSKKTKTRKSCAKESRKTPQKRAKKTTLQEAVV